MRTFIPVISLETIDRQVQGEPIRRKGQTLNRVHDERIAITIHEIEHSINLMAASLDLIRRRSRNQVREFSLWARKDRRAYHYCRARSMQLDEEDCFQRGESV